MKNVIVIVIILIILGLAAWYIYRSKKRGRKCIGCPSSAICGNNCGSCSSHNQCK